MRFLVSEGTAGQEAGGHQPFGADGSCPDDDPESAKARYAALHDAMITARKPPGDVVIACMPFGADCPAFHGAEMAAHAVKVIGDRFAEEGAVDQEVGIAPYR